MEVYDFVTADSVEPGDQVFVSNDPIEVKSVIDSGDAIMLKGWSHLTGDDATYILPFDVEVGLWTA